MEGDEDNELSGDESTSNVDKIEDYIEKMYSQAIEKLTKICFIAESDEYNNDSNAKDLSKQIYKFEVALERLHKIIKSGKAKSFSDSTLPIGLIKWVNESKNPLQWIQAIAIDKRNAECNKVKTASATIQTFKESLISDLQNCDFKNKLDIN